MTTRPLLEKNNPAALLTSNLNRDATSLCVCSSWRKVSSTAAMVELATPPSKGAPPALAPSVGPPARWPMHTECQLEGLLLGGPVMHSTCTEYTDNS